MQRFLLLSAACLLLLVPAGATTTNMVLKVFSDNLCGSEMFSGLIPVESTDTLIDAPCITGTYGNPTYTASLIGWSGKFVACSTSGVTCTNTGDTYQVIDSDIPAHVLLMSTHTTHCA